MLRKRVALSLAAALLLGMLPGGVLATEDLTYESNEEALEITQDGSFVETSEDFTNQEAESQEAAEVWAEEQPDDPEAWTETEDAPGDWQEEQPDEEAPAEIQENGITAPVFFAGVSSYDEAYPRQTAGEVIRRGIDVSQWQKEIDWEAVAASGVEFAIIRAAYRGYAPRGSIGNDTYFAQNMRGAKANGIKVGVYIFSQAITVQEAVEEAQYLMNCVRGYDIDLPLVIDYEFSYYPNGDPGRLRAANLSRQAGTDICNAFCAEVERYGYDSMVYANPSMLNGWLYREQLGRLWLAHYTRQTNYTGDYEYWQFSSSGVIDGISGSVDMNFWFDSGLPFRDVKRNDWFFDEIVWAQENNVIKGLSSTEFGPLQAAERGQVITMIHRLMGEPEATEELPYADLTEEYYKEAIRWGTQEKIVNGTGAGLFSPTESTQRQMLVTMLYRLIGAPESSQSMESFLDAGQVADYAADAMAWAVENGIIQGDKDKATLRPTEPCNRAEVATILKRYVDYEEKLEQEKPTEPEQPENPDVPPDTSDVTTEPAENG